MTASIYEQDGISFVTDNVSTKATVIANTTEENRIKYVTDIAAISRGKDQSNNSQKRYQLLLKEAAPTVNMRTVDSGDPHDKTAGRPLEFIPVVFKYNINSYDINNVVLTTVDNVMFGTMDYTDFVNKILRYSYSEKIKDNEYKVYSNMRALLNAGIAYDKIPYNKPIDVKDFVVIKANVPMFIWAQVPMTHTQLSKISQSDRVAESEDYWFPEDLSDKVDTLIKVLFTEEELAKANEDIKEYGCYSAKVDGSTYDTYCTKYGLDATDFINILNNIKECTLLDKTNRHVALKHIFLAALTQNEAQKILKLLGYSREIWSRAPYYFKYKQVIIGGWSNDETRWEHLFTERSVYSAVYDNWTQKETKEFAVTMHRVYDSYLKRTKVEVGKDSDTDWSDIYEVPNN